ncbi:MAG: cation transporter, partial [Sphaerotilus sulfidivorans]|uniref:cation transporter n=1 Tax=Sphaerotilus sulfidivorans TaxID=639200 RepID=UPI003F30ED5A
MSDSCCDHGHGHGHACSPPPAPTSGRYRRVLWAALLINAAMFAVEIGAGLRSGSVSLLADAIDFLGDAANYGVSLWVLGMSLRHRAGAALLKGASMGLFGLVVLGRALWSFSQGTVPEATTMGAVGALALLANVAVA